MKISRLALSLSTLRLSSSSSTFKKIGVDLVFGKQFTTMESLFKARAGLLDADGNTVSEANAIPEQKLTIDIDKIAKIYTETVRLPSVIRGRIDYDESKSSSCGGVMNIYTEWSLEDVSKKDSTKFARTFTVVLPEEAGAAPAGEREVVLGSSAPIPFESKLTVFSKSGTKKAVLIGNPKAKGGNGTNGADAELLQIFNRDGLVKTFDLKELDLHKGVYTHSFWGSTLAFSPDETKLIYLAEKKPPKTSPFFTSYSKYSLEKKDISPEKAAEEEKAKGQEFEFQQSWGEQLAKSVQSVIVYLDLETDKFQIVPIPEKLHAADLQWVGNESIIGTAYTVDSWKLGIIFCSNRESRIFQIKIGTGESESAANDKESEFRFISEPKIGAICPRPRPDSKYVVWLERELSPQHRSVFRLMGSSLLDIAPKILYDFTAESKDYIPIYQELPQNCWSVNGEELYVISQNGISNVLLQLKLNAEAASAALPIPNIHGILCVGPSNYILAAAGDTLTPNYPVLIQGERFIPLIDPKTIVAPSLVKFKRLTVRGSVSPDSFYYGPSDVTASSVPVILNPHGGPHAFFPDAYSPVTAFFLRLGFGVLRVNYVGSTGASPVDVTATLLGKIGQADVKDCQEILEILIKFEPAVDPGRVVYFGGSHAGFLGAHLSSAYPETYKAVVLVNPVTDLLAMVGSTDITDWCYAEAGLPYDPKSPSLISPSIQDPALALKLMECSPIRYVDKVTAPTLLLLGTEDLRVPCSQGKNYYRALLAAGKTAEIRLYPDNHGLGKTEDTLDYAVHTAIWFLKHLKQQPN